jgi:hypothetical protein
LNVAPSSPKIIVRGLLIDFPSSVCLSVWIAGCLFR